MFLGASRLEAIAIRLEAIASRLVGGRSKKGKNGPQWFLGLQVGFPLLPAMPFVPFWTIFCVKKSP